MLLLAGASQHLLAHATLVSTTPPAHAALEVLPDEAVLRFNEPVSPLAINLVYPDGTVEPSADASLVDNALHVTLPARSMQGTYGVSWRVVSVDGHPLGGTLIFALGAHTQDSPALNGTSPDTRPRAVLIWLTRVLVYLGLFAAAAVLYVGKCESTAAGGGSMLIGVGLAALAASIGLLGLDALDQPFGTLGQVLPWRTALATSYGFTAGCFAAALLLGLAAWQGQGANSTRVSGLLAVALLAWGFAGSGHASSAPPAWLARPAVWLHAAGIALWLGAFLPLLTALKRSGEGELALPRFSRWAPGIIAVILSSGAVLVYLQLTNVASLWTTPYGRVLGAKVLLVLVLLGLGAYNRFRLTVPALAGDGAARRRMQRIVVVEMLVALAILALAALWRFTPPPRALQTAQVMTQVLSASVASATARAEFTWDTASGQFSLSLSKPDLSPLAAQQLRVLFANGDAGIEAIAFEARSGPDGAWLIDGLALPPLPSWDLRIEALISDFELQTLATTVTVARQVPRMVPR